MEAPDVKVAQMGVKALAFAEGKTAGSFTHTPATKVDVKHAGAITKLRGAITALGGTAAIQEGRGFEEKSGEKKATFHDLEDLVRRTNKTAASIADDQKKPAIMDSFRMPHGHGETEWKTKALAMAKAITELGLADEFEGHNLPDHATALTDMANNFVSSQAEQGNALGQQVGATKLIPIHIKDIKAAVKMLDAIYENTFSGQAEVIGAWKSQSHVEKVASKKKKTGENGGSTTTGTTGSK